LKLDLVGLPVYSYGCAAGHAIRMSARITGRREVLVPAIIDPERLAVIKNYCEPPDMSNHIRIQWLKYDQRTGLVDLDDLEEKLSDQVAAVYFEVPSYFGLVEEMVKRSRNLQPAMEWKLSLGVIRFLWEFSSRS
jgi:glycine dehydrogenase subunit 1